MPSTPLHHRTLAELSKALAAREVSSVELTRHFLARIAEHDRALNSFITITADAALATAAKADARRAAGETGALLGLPIAHKDIFCTTGVRTSCASKMLDNFVSPYESEVTTRLAAAGMVMLGKTNMDEFAMGSSNETSFYGPVKNPWDVSRVPGGSSGGSAASVAARLAPVATGTDTGGSIRQPAALCNLTGLKPTYGRVSRWGMIAFASSLDQAGPMAQSAEDCALLMNAMSGHDAKDSTSLAETVPDYTQTLGDDIRGLRIGLPKQFFGAGLDAGTEKCVREAVAQFEKLGATVHEVDLPNVDLSVPVYYVIAPAECSSNLSRFDGVRFGHRCADPKDLIDLYERSRSEGFGAEVKRRILVGSYVLSAGYYDAYYLKAQQVRRLIGEDFARAFHEVDLILGPTSPSTAFRLGQKKDDPVAMYLADIYTIAVNLAGIPGLSMPCGFDYSENHGGLPVGMQLIGNHFSEAKLLNVAHQYQLATDWHRRIPEGFL